LQESAIKLDDLSPLSVLKRGFGIVRKLPEGFTVKDANSISAGDSVEVKLSSGGFKAKVTNILTER
jgi:exonuclease VII large subunit